ncbi:MAG: hypothetical protein ACR2LS_03860 [Thermomicrobiales bacterium]
MTDGAWGVVFVSIAVVATAALLAVIVYEVHKTTRSRITSSAVMAQDAAYRELAEQATAAQRGVAEQQQKIIEELAALGSRVGAIEKLLREVG